MANIKQLRKDLGADKAKAKEQLNFLLDAAKSKLELFKMEFSQKINNPDAFKNEILPTKIIAFEEGYRANISEGGSSEVESIVDNFLKGTGDSLRKGFSGVIELAFRSLLGDSSIGASYVNKWFITVEYGALIRVDLRAWRYNFSSDQIIEKIENIYCFIITKSFIDNSTLTKPQLNYFVAKSLNLKSLDEIIKNDTIKQYVEFLKQDYDENKDNRLSEAEYRTRKWEQGSIA